MPTVKKKKKTFINLTVRKFNKVNSCPVILRRRFAELISRQHQPEFDSSSILRNCPSINCKTRFQPSHTA